jgi:hypothetical protein
MSWQDELSCPLGLAPLSGLCSSHGVCVPSLVTSTSSCLCDPHWSGYGDFASFPDTDCHLYVPFGIATWCLLIIVTLGMVGAALRRLIAYTSEFLVPSFQEASELAIPGKTMRVSIPLYFLQCAQLPPIQMLLLIVFMASSWLVMSVLKLATTVQAGGRFDANVEAIGHSVAITIF